MIRKFLLLKYSKSLFFFLPCLLLFLYFLMAYTQCASMHAYICTFVLKCSCCLVNLVIITQLSSVNNNYIYTAIIGTLKKHQSNNTPSIQSQEGELFYSHCLSLINNSPFMFFKQLKQCKTKAMRNISKEEM